MNFESDNGFEKKKSEKRRKMTGDTHMLGEKEIRVGDTNITYKVEEQGAVIISGQRVGGFLKLPEMIEDRPVIAIAKKAFLGQSSLREVILPKSCQRIEDWGFAQCSNLTSFYAPNHQLVLGKGVFNHCESIRNICIGTPEKEDTSVLLALLADKLDGEYLLTDQSRGSREWFEKWDRRLFSYLKEPDDDGYMKLALCGEEDIMLNIPEFMAEKRKQKCFLCLIRLKHASHLSEEMRNAFVTYLKNLTKGCETEEAWQALFTQFDGDTSYYEVFADIGCITKDNLDAVLMDMGQEFAEAKAFLLRYRQEHFQKADVFEMFSL